MPDKAKVSDTNRKLVFLGNTVALWAVGLFFIFNWQVQSSFAVVHYDDCIFVQKVTCPNIDEITYDWAYGSS